MSSEIARSRSSYFPAVLGLAIVGSVFFVAKPVIVPLVLAILLAFVLNPIVNSFQRLRINRIGAVLATVLLAFSFIGAVGWVVGIQLHNLARELPQHRKGIEEKIAFLRVQDGPLWNVVAMFKEIADGDKRKPAPPTAENDSVNTKEIVVVHADEPSSAERLLHAVSPILEPLASTVLVIILVIFMLFDREDLRNRFIGLLGHGRMTGTTRLIVDTAHRLSQFLLTQLLINTGFGIVFATGLFFLGVEYAILWGFLTALLRFVPYIGTWISAILPLTLSFATAPDWTQPMLVLGYFVILDAIAANLVDPFLLGRSTGVSPIALLVAATFWTWLWGPIGLLLSTPLTVCLVVLGQHFPQFSFFSLLLGDQPALEPAMVYYQRLLARDESEAKDLALRYARTNGLEKVCDDMLLPALLFARRDRKQGGLTADDERYIFQASKEITDAFRSKSLSIGKPPATPRRSGEPSKNGEAEDLPEKEKSVAPMLIFGCPAHDEAEEASLTMLADLLGPQDCYVEVLSTNLLPVEIENQVARRKPDLIFIAILPPGGLIQARYLCKRFHKRFENIPIVVGTWGGETNFDAALKGLRAAGAGYVTTSLHQACSQIRALLHANAPAESINPEMVLQGARK